ncbi:hypothetical protein GDO78_020459 [Eleutherodactylus coqui]|uniref:Uncharacterized protein n=1 Tax=Eleutherodactylus coqui TaxID=57060 RepID=A0A8J6EBQ0_ELECQ|nr:hypothetical protein GDO78_020459 [Eleutherodactylus coqui]
MYKLNKVQEATGVTEVKATRMDGRADTSLVWPIGRGRRRLCKRTVVSPQDPEEGYSWDITLGVAGGRSSW